MNNWKNPKPREIRQLLALLALRLETWRSGVNLKLDLRWCLN